jgi:hypothetical protein
MDQPAEEEEDIAAGIERHASGTWKVYEELWFYMTQTPGFADIKMHMKTPFRTPEQMGRFQMSKALSPHHYGETLANPVKTRLLLQAWAIYRARLKAGWAEARPGRGRHVASMMVSLKTAIRAADTRQRPRVALLEHPAAHSWRSGFRIWWRNCCRVPDLCASCGDDAACRNTGSTSDMSAEQW